MKPQKAQVKDKGLGAESWDFGLESTRFLVISPKTCIGYQYYIDKTYQVEKTNQFAELFTMS